jgi:hypothetical protein
MFERRAGVVTLLLAVTGCSHDEVEPIGAVRATAISTELVIDPAVVQRPVPGEWPALTFGGGQYLAVWVDYRVGLAIYGARITVDGNSLDPLGIPLLGANPQAPIPNDVYRLSVASDGADFLVVTRMDGQVRGLRVNAAGEVLDGEGFVIATPIGPAAIPSLVFDGEHYLVVWADGTWPPGPDDFVRWARVTPDGAVLDPEGVPAYAAAYAWLRPSVSFDGNNYLLGWTDFDDDAQARVIEVGRMAPDGALLDDPPIQINPANLGVDPHVGPALGFDGANHVVASLQYEAANLLIRASRVTPDGTLLDPDGLPIHTQHADDTVHRLEVAAGSGHSIVVWSTSAHPDGYGPVMAARIEANGVVSGYPEDSFARGEASTVAASPDGALLLWGDSIMGARLDADGTVVGELSPVETASHQLVQAVASDGQDFLTLWVDDVPGGALYGGRVTATGLALNLEPIEIAEQAYLPIVVFDGVNYIVSWIDGSLGPQVTRVSPAGELLGGSWTLPLEAKDGASDGTHTLLIGSTYSSQLAAVLVNHELALASELVELVHDLEIGNAFDPRVIYDGLGYLVVWHNGTTVFGRRVSTAGAIAGERFAIAQGTSIHPLAMAFGGGTSLIVWQDLEIDGVWGTRVSADGQVLDPENFAVGEANAQGYGCAAAFDGEKFVVAWRTAAVADQWSTADLYMAEVSTMGEVLSTIPLSTGPEAEGSPFLAGANGHVLAAYSRFEPGAPYDGYRARARLITSLPAIDLDVQAPEPALGVSPVDLPVQAGGPQTPVPTSQTWPSPHSASDLHGAFLPAGGAVVSPAASAQGSSPM